MKNMATGFALTAFFLFLALVYFFGDKYLQDQWNPNRNIEQNVGGTIELRAAGDGHYRVSGVVNGKAVVFLLDTGATRVAIGQKLADELDIARGKPIPVFTANGQVTGYQTHIHHLEFAGFAFNNVPALIMPQMDEQILLGMSVLKKFHWQQQDGVLKITRL